MHGVRDNGRAEDRRGDIENALQEGLDENSDVFGQKYAGTNQHEKHANKNVNNNDINKITPSNQPGKNNNNDNLSSSSSSSSTSSSFGRGVFGSTPRRMLVKSNIAARIFVEEVPG